MSDSGPTTVVDTNVFVSGAICPIGAPRRVLRAWFDRRFLLLLSDEQHAELIDVFGRPRIAAQFRLGAEELAALFAGLAAATRAPLRAQLPVQVRDPKDAHSLAAALGGDADYLVTGDDDLLAHRGDPRLGRLKIVTAAEFLAILDRPAADVDQRT